MKKATRLLILTAFVFPLLTATRTYAGGPGPGQPIHTIPIRSTTGFHPTDPYHLQDPIADPLDDNDRDNRLHDHDRDPGHHDWDPGFNPGCTNGGATAPIDGGIGLLLAAGIGLGIKRARARKQAD